MRSKLLGGILLVVANTMGGGMLALPLISAQAGFIHSALLLILSWAIMVTGALFILEVNLWFPDNSHLISMARYTLGPIGVFITWISYLLLLYSLLAAYTAGGADFLRSLLAKAHYTLPLSATAGFFILALGSLVYQGIHSVDYLNRGLMGLKLFSYLLLVLLILPFVSVHQLSDVTYYLALPKDFMVFITAFGFAAIIPGLRGYFQNDLRQLRQAIVFGSLIPLLCYLIWNLVIMGAIPKTGNPSLTSLAQASNATSGLVAVLSELLHQKMTSLLTWLFTMTCLVTSFLGVSLSLVDFLADGLRLGKHGQSKWSLHLLALLPPLIIVLFYPTAFVLGLHCAGIFCIVLLVFLPVLMTWSGRYYKQLSHGYQVVGGKYLLALVGVTSMIITVYSLLSNIERVHVPGYTY